MSHCTKLFCRDKANQSVLFSQHFPFVTARYFYNHTFFSVSMMAFAVFQLYPCSQIKCNKGDEKYHVCLKEKRKCLVSWWTPKHWLYMWNTRPKWFIFWMFLLDILPFLPLRGGHGEPRSASAQVSSAFCLHNSQQVPKCSRVKWDSLHMRSEQKPLSPSLSCDKEYWPGPGLAGAFPLLGRQDCRWSGNQTSFHASSCPCRGH